MNFPKVYTWKTIYFDCILRPEFQPRLSFQTDLRRWAASSCALPHIF